MEKTITLNEQEVKLLIMFLSPYEDADDISNTTQAIFRCIISKLNEE